MQLGVFARAFAASHLGETDSLDRVGARSGSRSSTASLLGGDPAAAGIVTLVAIFVSWAIDGFGALVSRVRDRIGFTLVAVGSR